MSDWAMEIMGQSDTYNDRRDSVLSFVRSFYAERKYGPTIREIKVVVPASTSTIHKILKDLQRNNLVDWDEKLVRTLRPVNG